ncbi:unnamed protein product [Gulo gulo]|uniref:Uncharacterized protein n=1 Tax=Gulo gulo TaxID=48420 RepID=A0A9X9Q765_GULGU|nr:unnamed protein product [Gulo gulo]
MENHGGVGIYSSVFYIVINDTGGGSVASDYFSASCSLSVPLTPRPLGIETTMQATPCLELASQWASLTSSVESAWASWAVELPWLMHRTPASL